MGSLTTNEMGSPIRETDKHDLSRLDAGKISAARWRDDLPKTAPDGSSPQAVSRERSEHPTLFQDRAISASEHAWLHFRVARSFPSVVL
jgi:hypothetical protein